MKKYIWFVRVIIDVHATDSDTACRVPTKNRRCVREKKYLICLCDYRCARVGFAKIWWMCRTRRDTACRVRISRVDIDNRMKMVWHHHILQNINVWLMKFGIIETARQEFSYWWQMHFPIGNLAKIMYPILATNSYEVHAFVIFQPLCTRWFSLW